MTYSKRINDIASYYKVEPKDIVNRVLDCVPYNDDKCYRRIADAADITYSECWTILEYLAEQKLVRLIGIRAIRIKKAGQVTKASKKSLTPYPKYIVEIAGKVPYSDCRAMIDKYLGILKERGSMTYMVMAKKMSMTRREAMLIAKYLRVRGYVKEIAKELVRLV